MGGAGRPSGAAYDPRAAAVGDEAAGGAEHVRAEANRADGRRCGLAAGDGAGGGAAEGCTSVGAGGCAGGCAARGRTSDWAAGESASGGAPVDPN